MRKLLFFLSMISISASCNTTKNDSEVKPLNANLNEYLVFGKYFGHCINECANLYKLEGDQLFSDDMNRFTGWEDLKFQTKALPQLQYDAAKALLHSLPADLLKEPETIGCPDCADQGGFALEIRKDDRFYHWRIDTNRDQIPAYLRSYIDQIDVVIEQLKQ